MNGNYEWNKQLTHQRTQQRYREAELHRQVKQQQSLQGQARPDLRAIMGTVISLVHKKLTAIVLPAVYPKEVA